MNEVERTVRAATYEHFIEEAAAPSPADLAARVGLAVPEVRAALHTLHEAHRLVVGQDGEIVMAHPFSGRRTGYRSSIGSREWDANCGWDSFAILSMLGEGEAVGESPIDGTERRWTVEAGVIDEPGLVHFAVPARSLWDDIGYT